MSLKRIAAGVLKFEIIMIFVTMMILKPLISLLLRLTLMVSGYQLAFNDLILGFFLSVPGAAAAIIILLLSVLYIYFEYAVIIHFVAGNSRGSKMSLGTAVGSAFHSLKRLRLRELPGLMLYLLLLLPLVQPGISSTLLPGIDIPNFISGEMYKYSWGRPLFAAIYVLLFAVFLLLLWVLPQMVTEKRRFGEAVKRSVGMVRIYGGKIAGVYALFLLWKGLSLALTGILSAPVFHYSLFDIRRIYQAYGMGRFTFQLSAMVVIFTVLTFVSKHIMLVFLVGCQRRYSDSEYRVNEAADLILVKPQTLLNKLFSSAAGLMKVKRNKRIAVGGGILVMAFCTFLYFNGAPELHEPIVIGHRGSLKGVENSLEAIQGAIDSGADYAEIDVFLSADGIPVVIHDADLKRLTGDDEQVAELTAAQLQEYQLVQGEYQGQIRTLDEVLAYCKGKIKIAVELKSHGKEKLDLVTETLKVIDAHQYLDQVIFLSLNYDLVAAVQQQRPEATAGYCVYRNVGMLQREILDSMEIDFVVIEEAMASSELIFSFRKAWLPVYVWTVNDGENMQRYLEMGCVGLITDYPDLGVEMVSRFEETSISTYFEEE